MYHSQLTVAAATLLVLGESLRAQPPSTAARLSAE